MNTKNQEKKLKATLELLLLMNQLATIDPKAMKQALNEDYKADKERFKRVYKNIKGAKTQLPALLTLMELVIIEKNTAPND